MDVSHIHVTRTDWVTVIALCLLTSFGLGIAVSNLPSSDPCETGTYTTSAECPQ